MSNGNKKDYTDAGFDTFLRRESNFRKAPAERTPDELSASSPSARFTGQGRLKSTDTSQDGKTKMDWTNGQLSFTDGARNRVLLGNIEKTGKYGIRIIDATGNIRFESSDSTEILSMFDETKQQEIVRLDETGLMVRDLLENSLVQLNSDGLFVYDENGNILVQLDSSGILVNDGKIVIKDEDDVTAIDSKGVVSTTQFPFETSSLALNQSVTATEGSPVDVTNATYDVAVDRETNLLFIWTIRGYIAAQSGSDFDGTGVVGLKIGSDSIIGADTLVVGGAGGTATDAPEHTLISSYTAHQVKALAEGTTTCKLIAWIDQGATGNAKLQIVSCVFSYMQMGK